MTASVKDFDLNRLFTDKIYSGSALMNKRNGQSPRFFRIPVSSNWLNWTLEALTKIVNMLFDLYDLIQIKALSQTHCF